MNFAGGGHQVELPASQFSIDGSEGHVTVRKDDAGIVTIATCTAAEANATGTGQCATPVYADCDECQWGSNNTYACWCNAVSFN